jgi:ribosomal protein S18 acetylase RimI-like enzyme
MRNRNKTLDVDYRFLSADDFAALYKTCLAAFSDYFFPVEISNEQFENHIRQNAVDLASSVGAFVDRKMVGYTLCGFGLWNGKDTTYISGTGVIPEFRHKGIGGKMFEFLMPNLWEIGIEQMLLEVIDQNANALKLYQKLGFEFTRKLEFFEQPESLKLNANKSVRVRKIEEPDWKDFQKFWEGKPSWQFSSEAIQREMLRKEIFGAYSDNELVGYCVCSPKGIISQIAVDKDYRRKGIGAAILAKILTNGGEKKSLKFSNVDSSLDETIGFINRLGFVPSIVQLEMIKPLS